MSKKERESKSDIIVVEDGKSFVLEDLEDEVIEELEASLDDDSVIDISDSKEQNDLEILSTVKDLVVSSGGNVPAVIDPLKKYLNEISRYKLLTPEEEKELVRELFETGDIEVAKKLVMANLRLVVKIAMEYRSAHKNVLDLIQEGNLGLMKAVSKYDPSKGAKLSYYASWWIKSYILKFILDNFRLIKIGTTAEQKKLFYNLMREKERLMNQGLEPDVKMISESLGVSEKAVIEMDHRLSSSGQEVSIDTPLSSDGSSRGTIADMLEDEDSIGLEDQVADQQSIEILQEHLQKFVEELKPRDKEIFKKRLLSEVPPSLQAIADDYGVSRERIRQIEARLLDKLKVYMSDYLR
jgi:RNA polymerase sigma-32 factor